MLRFLLILLLACTSLCGRTQISLGHEQLVRPLQDLEVQSMPLVDNESLLQIELSHHHQNRPVHFAHPFATDISPSESGTWEEVGGKAIWRAVIESKTAHSINLGFSKFYLPSEAELFIFDYHHPKKSTPFVAADSEEHEQLWTPIFTTDKIVIELNVPIHQKSEVALQLTYVNHDFLDIQKSSTDNCHIDINCGEETGYPEVEKFREQIRSVGLYTLSGKSICSGFLINNTRQDCTPYFMTAFHCNLTASNAPSMVTYWNFENSQCRPSGENANAIQGDGSLETFNTGATWRAGWAESDFTLVELDDEVPTSANAFFAGWDISNNLPAESVLVHHPNLEEKRISFAYTSLYTGVWGSETTPIINGNHLVLDHWDLGSTEGGSSGAPLFNRGGLAVAQLHGGLASCENQEYDAFGRLHSSWTGGRTAATRLKDWLDPDGIGRLQLEGKNCVFEISLSDNNLRQCFTDGFFDIEVSMDDSFQGSIDLSLENVPNGASAFFSRPNVAANHVSTLTVANINNLPMGRYSLDIIADDGTNHRSKKLFFEIVNEFPSQPTLTLPFTEMVVDAEGVGFEWVTETNSDSYAFLLSDQADFANIVLEEITETPYLDLDFALQANQTYYWRVKASNECGISIWSSVSSFATVDLACIDIRIEASQEIDADAPGVITSTIENEESGMVQEIVVTNISGEHSFVSDLRMTLISPSGTEVILFNRKCSADQDFNLGFSDNSMELACPLTNARTFKPAMPLSIFNGELAQGAWTLKVEDLNKFDGGRLDAWSIRLCTSPLIEYSVTTDVDNIEVCPQESYRIPIRLGAAYDDSQGINMISSDTLLTTVVPKDGDFFLQVNPYLVLTPGSYPLQISASDEEGNTAHLHIQVNVLAAPRDLELLSPVINSFEVSVKPTFSWEAAAEGMDYQLQLSQDISFENTLLDIQLAPNLFSLDESLNTGTEYFWRVIATNRCGSIESEVFSFITASTNSVRDQIVNPISVYPNPVHETLHIAVDSQVSLDATEISLYTLEGKKVQQENRPSSQGVLLMDVDHLPAGMYLLVSKVGQQTYFNRVVVQ